jgi:hypothetical protein
MCRAFSCIVTKGGKTYWKAGLDSHDHILDKFKITYRDDQTEPDKLRFARVEITPDDGYLHPEGKWTLKIDERIEPTWWDDKHIQSAYTALDLWKNEVYNSFNLAGARNPIHPLLLPVNEVTESDIANLHQWASVWASVRDSVWDSVWDSVGASVGASVWDSVWASVGASVWDSVGASVRDSVWDSVGASVRDSVWAYLGGLFPNIQKWEGITHKRGAYPFQCFVDLWRRGFLPVYYQQKWHLLAGKDAHEVYTMEVK